MPVAEVKEGIPVEPNHVYVIPPNAEIGIVKGTLHLAARAQTPAMHLPIDHFLCSLAEDRGRRVIGVVLSGTGSDGTLGLKAVKAEGGITFAQDRKSAKYDGMPRSAVAAGCVDFVLPPDAIARELARIGRHPYLRVAPTAPAKLEASSDQELRQLLVVLRNATGVDFTYYKYSTIKRRVARRMLLHKLDSMEQYLKFMRENAAEPAALCEGILIHVTGFFREPEAFQALAERICPRILDTQKPGEPVRIWVPGCSTGEEAYSIAMVLLECLGDRAGGTPIQLFATDISDAAIERARAGIYSENSLREMSPERLRRFFVKVEGATRLRDRFARCACLHGRISPGILRFRGST
jgi:two-component system CheB/CheR fusion protein